MSYRGQVFTGQVTQSTVSKHWRKACNRVLWWRIIDKATLHYRHVTEEEDCGQMPRAYDVERGVRKMAAKYFSHTLANQSVML